MNSKRDHGSIAVRIFIVSFCIFVSSCWDSKEMVEYAYTGDEEPAPSRILDIDDRDIEKTIRAEIDRSAIVSGQNISVESEDHVVTLKGRVGSLMSKERATEISEMTKGVRSVVNLLVVEPLEDLPDEVLKANIIEALALDPVGEAFEIAVRADGGHVYLGGDVDSWQEREIAENIAQSVRGVRSVRNHIAVGSPEDRSDSDIRADIESALDWDALLTTAVISVQVDEGRARLKGVVGNLAEKRRAIWKAMVLGVRDVDASDLEIEGWAEREMLRPDQIARAKDKEIEKAMRAALSSDPRVDSEDVEILVEDGMVTLKGRVDDIYEKQAAVRNARSTRGVVSIESAMTVDPPGINIDKEVVARAEKALGLDPFVESKDIQVTSKNKEVTLQGLVPTLFQKMRAQMVVGKMRGVARVSNELTVNGKTDPAGFDPDGIEDWHFSDLYRVPVSKEHRPPVADDILQEAIEKALRDSPFVEAKAVALTVKSGAVVLEGSVGSEIARQTAAEVAFQKGARRVINLLAIK